MGLSISSVYNSLVCAYMGIRIGFGGGRGKWEDVYLLFEICKLFNRIYT